MGNYLPHSSLHLDKWTTPVYSQTVFDNRYLKSCSSPGFLKQTLFATAKDKWYLIRRVLCFWTLRSLSQTRQRDTDPYSRKWCINSPNIGYFQNYCKNFFPQRVLLCTIIQSVEHRSQGVSPGFIRDYKVRLKSLIYS